MKSFRSPRLTALAVVASAVAACSEPLPPTNIASTTPTSSTAVVNTNVSLAPGVRVTNKKGEGVGGVVVTFAVTGGGTLGTTTATTAEDGSASPTSWTLGKTAGTNTVTASVEGLTGSPVTFTASGTPGPVKTMTLNAGDGQTTTVGNPVITKPSVRVVDAFDNPVANATVTFTVTGGGGTITGGTATATATGLATVGSWTLGASPGVNTLSASTVGVSTPIVFTATGEVPTPPLLVSINGGDKQVAMVSAAVPSPPSVLVTSNGTPMAGVTVTWSVTSGGGVLTGANSTTDANGIATLGSWTLGSAMGLNGLQASVTGVPGQSVTGSPVSYLASGCGGAGAGYRITVCLTSDMPASQKAVFVNAAARWEQIITADLPDGAFSGNVPAGACGSGSFAIAANQVIDDLMIFASISNIDGVNGILGSAGPCGFRTASKLSLLGVMNFDVADMNKMETDGLLASVITHEMGHVLGIGSQWGAGTNGFNLLVNPSTSSSQLDTYFSGTNGIAGFNTIGGTSYTLGNKVPVANVGGAGSINSHWRESVLANELMTPTIGGAVNPLSALTVESLKDLGYTVNSASADPFFLTLVVTSAAPGAKSLNLGNDAYLGPQFMVDAQGRITRIR